MFKRRKREDMLTSKEIREKFKDVEFEKNDTLALFLAALLTFIPAILLVVGIYFLVIWLIFLR